MEKIIDTNLIRKLEQYKGFGIGLHGIGADRTKLNSVEETARAIMQDGLKLGNRYRSINGNVYSTGIVGKNDNEISRKLINYSWGTGNQTNIIVAYPGVIENSHGEKLYLGYTDSSRGYNKDTECSFMDKACAKLGYIPCEFILGYYTDSEGKYGYSQEGEHITYDFEENPNFCRSTIVSDELFRKMGDALHYSKPLSVACAKAVDTSDVSEVAKLMQSDLSLAKAFNSRDTIKFLKAVFKDISDRIMEREIEKGIEDKTDNEEIRRKLFDEDR